MSRRQLENIYPCFFSWKIKYPFLPRKLLQTIFYHEAPFVNKWIVKLLPVHQEKNDWNFTFVLQVDNSLHKRDTIFVETILMHIYLHDLHFEPIKASGLCFSEGNQYSYYFHMNVKIDPRIEPYSLVIQIELFLRDGMHRTSNVESLDTSRLLHDDGDLIALSRDLERLRINGLYSNMDLLASDGRIFHTHSYIINVRWNNFFLRHYFDQTRDRRVRLNISANLLSDILTYIYSGKLNRSWPEWENPPYITELFQVLNRYQMNHFYDVFVKRDYRLVCKTQKKVFTSFYIFEMNYVVDRPISDRTFTCIPQPDNEINLMLTISVGRCEGTDVLRSETIGCNISYTLHSTYKTEVYVRLTIEATRTSNQLTSENQMGQVWTLVYNDYHVCAPNQIEECQPILSEGIQYPAGEKMQTPTWYRFTISYTDGTTTEDLQSYNNSVQEELPRFNVLSNHMYRLSTSRIPIPPTMRVRCRQNDACYAIHKAIFAARVPNYDSVIAEMLEDGGRLPEIITIDLGRDAFGYVMQYIYTGKMALLPQYLFEEMWNFAEASGFECFKNSLVVRRNREVE